MDPPVPLRKLEEVSEVPAEVPSRRQLPHVAREDGVRAVSGVDADGGLSSSTGSRGGSEVVMGSKVTRSCFGGCCGTGVASMSRAGIGRDGAVCGLESSMVLRGWTGSGTAAEDGTAVCGGTFSPPFDRS